MYTQHPQFHQIPQFYPNQNIGFVQSLSPQVIYSNTKLQHINCVIPQSEEAGGLYIGDTICTLKRQILINNNIQAILCCNAQAAKNIYSIQLPIDFHYINIQDHIQYPIKIHFQQSISFIQQKLKNKKNVLVQCHAGASRSATIIIAYLIKSKSWTLEQAFQYLKEKRQRVKPNLGFLKQLQQYSLTINQDKKEQKLEQKQIKNQIQREENKQKQEQVNYKTPTKQKEDQIPSKIITQVQSQKINRKISEFRSQQHTPDKLTNYNQIDTNNFKFHTQRKNVELPNTPKKSVNGPYEQKQKQMLRHSISGYNQLPYMIFPNQNKKWLSKTQQGFGLKQQQPQPIINYNNPIYYSPQTPYQNNYYYSPQPIKLGPEYYVYSRTNNYSNQQYQPNPYDGKSNGYSNGFIRGDRGY